VIRTFLSIFVLLVLFAVAASPASAQQSANPTNPCTMVLTANDLGIDLGVQAIGWELVWQNTVPGLGGTSLYQVMRPLCTPSVCPDCILNAGKPIHLATGNTFIKETDVQVPGLGGGLSLTRTWNSIWPTSEKPFAVGLFGPGWRSTYEERLYIGSDGYFRYIRGDASFWSFGWSGNNVWTVAAPQNISATLTIGSSVWTITFQNGEQRQFSPISGDLTAIIDRNGNTTQLAYDGIGRLTTVTDPASRTLTFTYQSPTSFLITGVTSSTGTSLSYQAAEKSC